MIEKNIYPFTFKSLCLPTPGNECPCVTGRPFRLYFWVSRHVQGGRGYDGGTVGIKFCLLMKEVGDEEGTGRTLTGRGQTSLSSSEPKLKDP